MRQVKQAISRQGQIASGFARTEVRPDSLLREAEPRGGAGGGAHRATAWIPNREFKRGTKSATQKKRVRHKKVNKKVNKKVRRKVFPVPARTKRGSPDVIVSLFARLFGNSGGHFRGAFLRAFL